ncbi:MAG: Lrp/AsnC family transcriptional regulator [Conexivisphaerales archaeon]|jgi:DNA-binding Lrp family transcriptional regulator
MDNQAEMDELDMRILREYLRDARLSYRKVAERLSLAVGTVLSRTKKLERAGVIKGYSAVLDQEKLGYTMTVVTEMTVSKGKLLETEKEIAQWPMVCAVYDATGLTDMFIIAKFKSREDLSGFTKKLLSLPHAERTNTHVVLTTVKEDFRLL